SARRARCSSRFASPGKHKIAVAFAWPDPSGSGLFLLPPACLQVRARFGESRPQAKRLGKLGNRLGAAAGRRERRAEVEAGVGVVRVETRGGAKFRDRLLQTIPGGQGDSEIVMRLGVPRPQPDRL